jgi:PHP family Zn ribbon phosphoesterase
MRKIIRLENSQTSFPFQPTCHRALKALLQGDLDARLLQHEEQTNMRVQECAQQLQEIAREMDSMCQRQQEDMRALYKQVVEMTEMFDRSMVVERMNGVVTRRIVRSSQMM